MIINIKNKDDLITIDLRIKQIRYLKDIDKHGEIFFIDLSNSDIEGYNYLFIPYINKPNKKHLEVFFNCLKEDIKSFLDIDINVKDLEVLK